MKVTKEKVENSQAYLTVEMESGEMAESFEEAYRHLAQKVNIPGFRKGKAPRPVVERHVGKDRMLDEAIEHLIPKAYQKAVEEQCITPFAQPEIEITQAEPVIFKATVPLPPTVKLGDYKNFRLTPDPVEKTEDKIDQVLEEIRHQHATWEPVERPIEFGDLVVIDVDSEIEEQPFLKKIGLQYQALKESNAPAPGFAEQLVGLKAGEEKKFKITYPEDYLRKDVAGKEATFKIKVEDIKEEKLPPLDDELAQKVSADFKTLEILREEVAKNLEQNAQERARVEYEEKVINSIVDQAQVEFPPVLVDMEINRLMTNQARQLQMSGRSLDDYLASIKKTPQELAEELRPIASRNVLASLVLGEVSKEENIEVTEADIDGGLDGMLMSVAEDQKEEFRKVLNTQQTRDSIRDTQATRKTIERLISIVKGNETSQSEEKEGEK